MADSSFYPGVYGKKRRLIFNLSIAIRQLQKSGSSEAAISLLLSARENGIVCPMIWNTHEELVTLVRNKDL